MITRPMLACAVDDVNRLRFPLGVTPKLDGIRALKLHDDRVVTRSFKPIPNLYVAAFLKSALPPGADGEIVIPGMDFNSIQSAVMTQSGKPAGIEFAMFDYVAEPSDVNTPYEMRMAELMTTPMPSMVVKITPLVVHNLMQLRMVEDGYIEAGYEGIILRRMDGRYKCGRSTFNEHLLLKLKRMEDAEAVVIGFEEKMTNNNSAGSDAFGNTKRPTYKAGLEGAATLGALNVRDLKTGIEFNIGTGFDDDLRRIIWENQTYYLGKIVTYRYQNVGTKEKPRFPSFKGFRAVEDMS